MRFLIVGAVAALIAGCAETGGGAGPKDSVFCPNCQTYCGEGCPTDPSGNCKACGKTPVKAKTCELTWQWCKSHAAWHAEKPCGDNDSKKCCEASKPAVAMCVAADAKGLEKVKYCPACRCFCGKDCPTDDKGACKACGKTPVDAEAMAGSWHWCTGHKTWHAGDPCGDHATKKCCEEKKARVLVCR